MLYEEVNREARPFGKWEVVGHFWIPLGKLPSEEFVENLANLGATVCEYGAVHEEVVVGPVREWFALKPL